jgi:catechol 2,3-dioxygenase-like lactoylglutathione lyase family enzyme
MSESVSSALVSILKPNFAGPIVRVRNVDASRAWWQEVLDAEVSEPAGRGERRWATLTLGPSIVTLWQLPDGVERDRSHNDRNSYVVLNTEADIHDLRTTLIERGVESGRMQETSMLYFFWFHDPDGNRYEVSCFKDS